MVQFNRIVNRLRNYVPIYFMRVDRHEGLGFMRMSSWATLIVV